MTEDVWHRCQAVKKDGSRCLRVAKEGNYCNSHRNHKPLIDTSKLDPVRDLRLDITGDTSTLCEDCQDESVDVPGQLCRICGEFQTHIEAEICYGIGVLDGSDPAKMSQILDHLSHLGVNHDVGTRALERMYNSGRLIRP